VDRPSSGASNKDSFHRSTFPRRRGRKKKKKKKKKKEVVVEEEGFVRV
jgi:hypothetical protein